MPKDLWPHQERGIDGLKHALIDLKRANKPVRIMLQAPTGAGKTVLSANIVRGARSKGNRVCFVVDAISLIDQTVQSFSEEDIAGIGVIQADHPLTDSYQPVQVASVQTLERRQFPDVDVVMIDEAHCHYKVIERWMEKCPDVVFIGLSATPWTKGLGKWYHQLVVVSTIKELIDLGVLCSFEVYAPSIPDLSKVGVQAGEFKQGELSEAMSDVILVGDAVENWKKYGPGDKTLIFCVDRAHARHIQNQFYKKGVQVEYIDAFTPREQRAAISRRFHSGETKGVVSVGTMIKGIDWDVRCIVDCQPTKSEMRHCQKIGRGLRSADGKDRCIILDHASNHCGRPDALGFVTDIHHADLDMGKKKQGGGGKKKKAAEKLPKICQSCSHLKPIGVHKCPMCGFAPVVVEAVETQDGELEKVSSATAANKSASNAEKRVFFGQLKKYAMDHNYSLNWASHKYRERFGVWPNHYKDAPMCEPSPKTLGWIRSRQIAWAKSKRRAA